MCRPFIKLFLPVGLCRWLAQLGKKGLMAGSQISSSGFSMRTQQVMTVQVW